MGLFFVARVSTKLLTVNNARIFRDYPQLQMSPLNLGQAILFVMIANTNGLRVGDPLIFGGQVNARITKRDGPDFFVDFGNGIITIIPVNHPLWIICDYRSERLW